MAFARFHLLWIGQYDSESSFQKIENRDPVGPGTFHYDVRDLLLIEPGPQPFQIRDCRIEAPSLTVWLFRGRPGQDAAKQKTLADVNAGAAFNDFTHGISSSPKSRRIRHKLFHGLLAQSGDSPAPARNSFIRGVFSAIPATSFSSATEPR
jgi:hypothetical protein